MEWIVCNKCGCNMKQRKLKITSCSHIFCETCLSSDNNCLICQICIKSIDIGPGLPKNVLNMFRDIKDVTVEIHKKMLYMLHFQKTNNDLLEKRKKKKMIEEKERLAKYPKKLSDLKGQQEKIEKVAESTEKKLKERMAEIEKLEKLVTKARNSIQGIGEAANFEDFLRSSTPSLSSCPSVASSSGSRNEQDALFDFGILDVFEKVRSQSSSSSCSSVSSVRTDEPLF